MDYLHGGSLGHTVDDAAAGPGSGQPERIRGGGGAGGVVGIWRRQENNRLVSPIEGERSEEERSCISSTNAVTNLTQQEVMMDK